MLGEIDKNFYCGGVFCSKKDEEIEDAMKHEQEICFEDCFACHRKYPTPEQFKEEYGVEYPDDGAVYSRRTINDDKTVWGDWRVMFFGELKTTMKIVPEDVVFQIVCACTPFGKPGRDWRT